MRTTARGVSRAAAMTRRAKVATRAGAARIAGLAGLAVMAITVVTAVSLPAAAAPLDALLTALPGHGADRATLEISASRLNPLLGRPAAASDAAPAAAAQPGDPTGDATQTPARTQTGDLRTLLLAGAVRVGAQTWLSASLGRQQIDNDADTFVYRHWGLAGQYRFNEPAGAVPALALRLSAWGHRASSTATHSPVRVPGAILDTVTIRAPSDRQLQADLIATWLASPALDLSAQLGAGSTRLAYGALAATTTRNGCAYQLAFNGNDIFGTLAGPCSASGGVIKQFYDSSGGYGVNVAQEIAWHGHFVQAGANAAWRSGPWSAQAGYLLHSVRRDAVDAILAARGTPVIRQNHSLVLASAYQISPHLDGLLRAQFSNKLFFDAIPVTYNSSTAARFGSHYSVLTLGLRARF